MEISKDVRIDEPLDRVGRTSMGNNLILGQKDDKGSVSGLVYLGKCFEKNHYNANVWLSASRPHVIYVVGKRGEGKSYDLGILAEGLAQTGTVVSTLSRPQTVLLFDTQSQFWTLGFAPDPRNKEDSKQSDELNKWGIQPSAVSRIQIFIPRGEEKIFEGSTEFVIDPSDMDSEDWCGLFGLDPFTPVGNLVTLAYRKVTRDGYHALKVGQAGAVVRDEMVSPSATYDLDGLIDCVRYDEDIVNEIQESTRNALLWRLQAAQEYPLFGRPGITLANVIKEGHVTLFLLRNLSDEMKGLVVGLLIKKIFRAMGLRRQLQKALERASASQGARLKGKVDSLQLPPTLWVLADEAHVLCPANGNTAAKKPLIEFVRRGRDAGLSLVMATQQPSAVDSSVLQTDIEIVHRLTIDEDIGAAKSRLPAPFPSEIKLNGKEITEMRSFVRQLGVGEVLMADSEANRAIVMQMRPRVSAHGGGETKVE